MRRHLLIVNSLIAVAITGGCTRNDAPVSVPVPKAPVTPQRVVATPAVKQEEKKQSEEKKSLEVTKPQPKASDVGTSKAAAKAKAVKKSERVAILAPGGPIAVDVQISIDGRSHAEVFDDAVTQVLIAAGGDKGGRPTWKKLAANSKYLTGKGNRMPGGAAAQLRMWTEQYDRNRDGEIQRDEAASWLGRDSGVSARAFDVRGSRSYMSVPSAGSRIWKLMDADDNNRLSKEEIAHGPEKLFALDENDDGIVSSEELIPLRERLRLDGDQGSTSANATNAYAAIYLEPQYEVDRLGYLLSDLYARGQALRPSNFPALADIYKRLDSNGDDQLTQDELAAIRTMSPQLKLAVDFRPNDAQRRVSLTVLEHIPEIAVALKPAGDRVILQFGGTRIVVSATDRIAEQGPAAASAGGQIRMMVHDQCDALAEALDADADGRLGEREIATCAQTLSKFDINRDGQITNDELPYTMIAAIVRGERPGEQSLYRPASAAKLPTAGDAPSWFVSADYNEDGYVSRREFLGTTEEFTLLDKDRDGFISADEAKQSTNASTKTDH